MDLQNRISRYYQLSPTKIKECLNQTAKSLNLPLEDLLKIFDNIFKLELQQRFNLSTVSFDIILNKIFPQLNLADILSVCSINKDYYRRCQNNDLYWQQYLKKNYQITHKPEKYEKWFDLIKAIHLAPDVILRPNLNRRKLLKPGYYPYYKKHFRINNNHRLELEINDQFQVIDTPLLKQAVPLYYRKNLEYIVAADLNNLLIIYKLNDLKVIEMPSYDSMTYDFSEAGKVLQIQKLNAGSCLVLTQNALYYILARGSPSVNKIPLPIKFKFMNVYMYLSSAHIAFIDVKGEIWIRGNFNLGQYQSSYKKFTKITTSHPKMVEVALNIYDGEFYLIALDQGGDLWSIGDIGEDLNKPKLTKIDQYHQYDRHWNDLNQTRTNFKFKSISWYNYEIIAITTQNQIINLREIDGDYYNTGIIISEKYIKPHFESTGMISQGYGYIKSKELL